MKTAFFFLCLATCAFAQVPLVNIQPIGPVGTGNGNVTSVSVVTANGVSGSVATATTTPAITLTLGAITPTTVNGDTVTTGTGTLTLGATTLTSSHNITLDTDGSGTRTLNIAAGGTLGSNAFTSTGYLPLTGGTLTGALLFTDNTYDIGASAATRPRTGYFGTSVITPALTDSGLTATRVPFASTGGLLADASTLTFNSGTGALSATSFVGAGTSLTGIPYTITGTANQIAASAGTGNITLSIPTNPTLPGNVTVGTGNLSITGLTDTRDELRVNRFGGTQYAQLSAFAGFTVITNKAAVPDIVLQGTTDGSSYTTYASFDGVAPSIAGNLTVSGTLTSTSSGCTRVTANVTNATATMSAISDLSFTATSGTKYVGTIQIFGVDSVNTDGLSFDLGGGSATFTDIEFGFGAQPAGSTLGTVTSTAATTPITLTIVSTSDAVYTISFGFTCNAGGTFIPRFAQNSHSTGTATARKNSAMIIQVSSN